ncbi:MAG: hypothetical protein AAFY48_23430, partial [Bacteroidota bacterium]
MVSIRMRRAKVALIIIEITARNTFILWSYRQVINDLSPLIRRGPILAKCSLNPGSLLNTKMVQEAF